jgi:hypothetical protein
LAYYKNIPIAHSQNIPIATSTQCYDGFVGGYVRRRRYSRAEQIEKLAVEKHRKNGKGITFNDLLHAGLASNKRQSQITLKHYHNKDILFTISLHKPQQYYPTCIKSEVLKSKISKNIPIGVTGVGRYSSSSSSSNSIVFSCSSSNGKSLNNDNTYSIQDLLANQSLEGHVLPLLPSSPSFIHKMQFKLRITPECYSELKLPVGRENKGKEYVEMIGNVRVCYRFYSKGTVMVFTESSNNPFKLEDEIDRSRIIAFFGQIRDRLITFLMDRHERIVPDIMEWELTGFDINKDVRVSDWFHWNGSKTQVKHLDHLFRIYIKSKGKDTVCRVEESVTPNGSKGASAIDTINNIINPNHRMENLLVCIHKKIDDIHSALTENNNKKTINPSSHDNDNATTVHVGGKN